jgi:probable F420-dependent oxidoreductase
VKLGLFGINTGPCADPETAARVAQAAEAAGFESVWTGEHVVLPDPQAPPSPAPPELPMLDPAVSLAFLAAGTVGLRLGTGIIILPQRNPLVLAKELASLDVVSHGRLVFGLGVGYLKPEFDALGVPFEGKGPRADDYIRAIKALWTMDKPAYEGRYVRFRGIQAFPRPIQKPHPPIVVGGMSDAAFRRAVRLGNGWYGFALDLERTRKSVEGLRAAAQAVERPRELGPLEISVTPIGAIDRDAVKRYEDLGVERLTLLQRGRSADDLVAFVEKTAADLLGR